MQKKAGSSAENMHVANIQITLVKMVQRHCTVFCALFSRNIKLLLSLLFNLFNNNNNNTL